MKLKSILLIPGLAVATLGFQNVVQAQPAPPAATATPASPGPKFGPEENHPGRPGKKGERRNPEERMARLKEVLALTPDQEAKIREIFRNQVETMRAEHKANKGNPPSPEERKKKFAAARDRVNGLIRAVLTPEQQTKFDAFIAQMKARHDREEKPAPKP